MKTTRQLFHLLIALAAAISSHAAPPTEHVFTKLGSAADLYDGIEVYLYTDELPSMYYVDTTTRERQVGFIYTNYTFSFRDLSRNQITPFKLIANGDYWLLTDGASRIVAYQYFDNATHVEAYDTENINDTHRMSISTNDDGSVNIISVDKPDYVLAPVNDGMQYYSAMFTPLADQNARIPIYMAAGFTERLKNKPVIIVQDGWDVSVVSPDGCEVLYQITPVAAGAAAAQRKAPLTDNWKTWNDENWIPDRDAIMEDHYFVAKCRDGNLESDTTSTIIHSMVLTGADRLSTDGGEAHGRETFQTLDGRPVDNTSLIEGRAYLRRRPDGTVAIEIHR